LCGYDYVECTWDIALPVPSTAMLVSYVSPSLLLGRRKVRAMVSQSDIDDAILESVQVFGDP
jgi:hypothetical protein